MPISQDVTAPCAPSLPISQDVTDGSLRPFSADDSSVLNASVKNMICFVTFINNAYSVQLDDTQQDMRRPTQGNAAGMENLKSVFSVGGGTSSAQPAPVSGRSVRKAVRCRQAAPWQL